MEYVLEMMESETIKECYVRREADRYVGNVHWFCFFYKKMEETQETTGFQPFALSPKDLTYYWSATEKGGDSKDAWSMRLYADDKMTGYGLNTGYSDKEKKEYYLRCIRDIP